MPDQINPFDCMGPIQAPPHKNRPSELGGVGAKQRLPVCPARCCSKLSSWALLRPCQASHHTSSSSSRTIWDTVRLTLLPDLSPPTHPDGWLVGSPADAPGFHNPDIISPHLDELHSQGVELMDHHVYRYCAPTRSSFLSGRLCAPALRPPPCGAPPCAPRPAGPAAHLQPHSRGPRGAWAQAVQAGGDAQELQPRDGKGRAAPLVQDHRGQATERGLLGAAPPFPRAAWLFATKQPS